MNCESTLEEKYIAEERYNTLCARICRYADSAYPDGAKIIACYLNGETLESTAKELHLTVRAVHYMVTSIAPIPMATMVNREWGQMGSNYLRSLFALGFQAFLIMVCVAIYAVLVQSISAGGDIGTALWTCIGYTVLLCFTLFKTSSVAKSVFNAH